jgi:hypothetical protein
LRNDTENCIFDFINSSYYYLGDKNKAKAFGLELLNKYPNNREVGLVLLRIE